MKHKLIFGVLILLAVVMALAVLGSYLPEIDAAIERKRMNDIIEKLEKQKATHEAALRADFDGGKTPEATIDLLIAALKKGDVVQASKYYDIDVQAKALKSLQDELKEKGNLQTSIAYFTEVRAKGKKTCEKNKYEEGCDFIQKYVTTQDETVKFSNFNAEVFVPKGTNQERVVSLVLNKFTRIWKMRD